MQTLSNGDKYLAVQIVLFLEFVTEPLGAIQDYYAGRVEMGSALVLVRDSVMHLQITDVEE